MVVGHNDSEAHPSHFIAINVDRHVDVIEFPGGDASKARIYQQIYRIFTCSLSTVLLDREEETAYYPRHMSEYHLPIKQLSSLATQKAREKRKQVLAAVYERRSVIYSRFYKKMQLQSKQAML